MNHCQYIVGKGEYIIAKDIKYNVTYVISRKLNYLIRLK